MVSEHAEVAKVLDDTPHAEPVSDILAEKIEVEDEPITTAIAEPLIAVDVEKPVDVAPSVRQMRLIFYSPILEVDLYGSLRAG